MKTEQKDSQDKTITRQDMTALIIGIFGSLAFVILIWLLGPKLDSIQLAPDQGASWYF